MNTRTRIALSGVVIAVATCWLTAHIDAQSDVPQSVASRLVTLIIYKDEERRDWVSIGRLGIEWTGPNNHCSSDCDDYDDDWPRRTSTHKYCLEAVNDPPQLGDRRWVGEARITQTGGPGGYDRSIKAWYSDDDRCVNGKYDARTWPTTYEIGANAMEFAILGYATVQEQRVLMCGRDASPIDVAKNVVRVQFKVLDASGDEIESGGLEHGMTSSLFKRVRVSDKGDYFSYVVSVKEC